MAILKKEEAKTIIDKMPDNATWDDLMNEIYIRHSGESALKEGKTRLTKNLDEIKKLSLSEKILIVEEIWDSIVRKNQYPELTESQETELIRRIDSYHYNPKQGRTWDEIKAKFWKSK